MQFNNFFPKQNVDSVQNEVGNDAYVKCGETVRGEVETADFFRQRKILRARYAIYKLLFVLKTKNYLLNDL